MREFRILACLLAATFVSACGTTPNAKNQVMPGPSTAAISEILARDSGTPGQLSLVATLEHELSIARLYADYASRRPEDVRWIQTHLRHLRHSLDPSSERDGPGLGYGVVRAANNLGDQLGAIIGASAASQPMREHARQAQASLENIVSWANEILILSANALTEPKLSPRLIDWLGVIKQRLAVMHSGVDADRDQQISAKPREGGLVQARTEFSHVLAGTK